MISFLVFLIALVAFDLLEMVVQVFSSHPPYSVRISITPTVKHGGYMCLKAMCLCVCMWKLA